MSKNRLPMKVFLARAAIVSVLVVGGVLAFMAWFKQNYTIMFDPQSERCLPNYHVYLVDKNNKDVERGKPYAFKARGVRPLLDNAHVAAEEYKKYYEDGRVLLKMADGMPGDEVKIGENNIWINGVVHPTGGLILSKTLNIPKSRFVRTEVISNGEYWFFGRTTNSFDSRYWGGVSQDQIVGRAYPLF